MPVPLNAFATTVIAGSSVVGVFRRKPAIPARRGRQKGVRIVILCLRNAIPRVSLFFLSPHPLSCDINLHMVIGCCARRLLSAQPDFQAQKSDIEETIEMKSHLVLYYPKFHCELNHIEYFWSHSKRYARENCNYKIEGLRKTVPASLAHVANSTILACSNSCLKKMELYRQGVAYGSGEWKKLTSHQKPYLPGDDR